MSAGYLFLDPIIPEISNVRRLPLVHVSSLPAARGQPLGSWPTVLVESRENRFDVAAVQDPVVAEERREYGRVLDAEAGASTVMRRACVGSVTDNADAALIEGRERVVCKVEEPPLGLVSRRVCVPACALGYR